MEYRARLYTISISGERGPYLDPKIEFYIRSLYISVFGYSPPIL